MAGTYRPPFGPVGRALDRALLHRVASATIREFTAQVAARITDRSGAVAATLNGAGVTGDQLRYLDDAPRVRHCRSARIYEAAGCSCGLVIRAGPPWLMLPGRAGLTGGPASRLRGL
jgi:hypothetical protein